jgi:hypothetical protein
MPFRNNFNVSQYCGMEFVQSRKATIKTGLTQYLKQQQHEKKFLICLCAISLLGQAQTTKSTVIQKVTVFASSAQVERETKVTLKKGEQKLLFSGLSADINASTIRVRPSDKDALIRLITYRTEYTESDVNKDKLDVLYAKLEAEKRNIEVIDAKKSGLLKEAEFMNSNIDVNGSAGMRMTLAEFQQTESFFRKKMESIQTELYDLEVKRKNQLAIINSIVLDIKKAGSRTTELNGLIEVTLEAKQALTTDLRIDYLVNNAGWTPEYELRVDEVGKPVALELKAKLVQVTDIDWNKVKLAFSTGDPNRGSESPTLVPWYITQPVAKPAVYNKPAISQQSLGVTGRFYGAVLDAETSEPMPYANVIFYGPKGNVIATVVTDYDGVYSYLSNDPVNRIEFSFIGYQTQIVNAPPNGQMNVRLQPETQQLSEVTVTASDVSFRASRGATQSMSVDGVAINNMPYRQKRANKKERKAKVTSYNARQMRKAISQVYEADVPYTVKSDGKEIAVSLQEYELPVDYSYVAIPKLDEDAFLEAQLFGWDTLGLISGNIKVFIEGSFVGNSTLDVNALDDTLSFSLGRDPNVVVKRTDVPESTRKSFFGGKRIRTIAYQIEVRNNKKVPITLELQDQFPLSPSDDIQIERGNVQDGKVETETGIVTWNLELKPGEQITRTLQFEVTYPKNVQVYF